MVIWQQCQVCWIISNSLLIKAVYFCNTKNVSVNLNSSQEENLHSKSYAYWRQPSSNFQLKLKTKFGYKQAFAQSPPVFLYIESQACTTDTEPQRDYDLYLFLPFLWWVLFFTNHVTLTLTWIASVVIFL